MGIHTSGSLYDRVVLRLPPPNYFEVFARAPMLLRSFCYPLSPESCTLFDHVTRLPQPEFYEVRVLEVSIQLSRFRVGGAQRFDYQG